MKILNKILPIALLATAFAACDEVDVNDRLIDMPAIEADRVVLLEEFTGQKCVNCPEAHQIIESLLELHPNNLIAVSIHGGGDAWSYDEEKYPFGLANADGQAYAEQNGVYTFPAGIVDRVSGVQGRDQWAAAIRSELEKPSSMSLSVTPIIDGAEIRIDTQVTSYSISQPSLVLWVVEDGIIARQQSTGGKTLRDYEHNNVFRGCVNGRQGEPFQALANTDYGFSHTIAVKDNWNVDNLSIVAFLYDSNGVMQAAKAKVTTKQEAQ